MEVVMIDPITGGVTEPRHVLCVVHLFKGKEKPALTWVKGYAVCKKHLSFKELFYREWEGIQDPKQLKKNERKYSKMED